MLTWWNDQRQGCGCWVGACNEQCPWSDFISFTLKWSVVPTFKLLGEFLALWFPSLIPLKWTSNSNASWIDSFRRCQSHSVQGPSPLQVGKLRVREGLKGFQTADGRSRTWVPQASVFLKQVAHKTPGDWHSCVYFFILTALTWRVCPPWTWIHWHESTLKV